MDRNLPLTENALGEFLRSRRAELGPREVGLPEGGHARRVPGLRREEVAQLAGISIDYYNRLEQGRLNPSRPVLAAIARSLRLNEDQLSYLQQLVHQGAGRRSRRAAQTVGPQTLRLLDNLQHSATLVLGRYVDILAWNPLAAALYCDFAALPLERRNFILLSFLEPEVRDRYADWDTTGRLCVAYLRMDAARFPGDDRLNSLIGELSVQDEDFRRWWAAHQVALPTFGEKRFRHPKAGTLMLDWQMLGCAEDREQSLFVLGAAAGSDALAALLRL